jgi:multidrug resistance efflux pump
MGFLDKAKAAAEQAAAKAKEGVEDVQAKRELGQAYNELGRATFELIESGAISDPRLDAHAERIRAAQTRAAGDEVRAGVGATGSGDGHDPEQPPAMPT